MGGRPKMPPPGPPPPAPKDEGDVVNLASLLAQRQAVVKGGYRSFFFSGPRGPGGPEWAAPTEVGSPGQPPPPTSSRPPGSGVLPPSQRPNLDTSNPVDETPEERNRRRGGGTTSPGQGRPRSAR